MKYTFTLIITVLATAGLLTSMSSNMQTKDDEIRELKQQRDYWHKQWKKTMEYWKACEGKLNE
jgi:SMC interacting uncharacterized protein involved in chromosome segregation